MILLWWCAQMRDGRIAYVDFGNVAQLSQRNKQVRGVLCRLQWFVVLMCRVRSRIAHSK